MSTRWQVLTVSTSMAWPHKYISPTRRPTPHLVPLPWVYMSDLCSMFLFPSCNSDSSDRRPAVLWVTMACGRLWTCVRLWPRGRLWTCGRIWPMGANGWPHGCFPIPPIHCSVYTDLPPSRPFCPPPWVFCPSWWWGGGGWCLNPFPLTHCRLRRCYHSARDIQLTPRITNIMSSVGSPANDLRSFCH